MKYKSLVLEKYPHIKCEKNIELGYGYNCTVIDENDEITYLSEGAAPSNAWRECWAYVIRDGNNPYWKRDCKLAQENFKKFIKENPNHIQLTNEDIDRLAEEVKNEFGI